jgi:site-specific DNA recombinase
MNAVLYARVSSKEQAREGFSIPAQQKLLREYAREQGFTIVKEFTDIETAKAAGRTSFNEMISFIKKANKPLQKRASSRRSSKTGKLSKKLPDPRIAEEALKSGRDLKDIEGTGEPVRVILVEKTDRLYRNLKDWVTIDDVTRDFDLEIHLVKEGSVISNDSRSADKFMHGIKVLMAKNYIDNLSEEIKKGMKEKVAQGGYPHKPPVGYFNNPETRKIDIDPKTAPYIRKLFELYASGNYSLRGLRKKCMEDRFYIKPSEPIISVSSLERILKNEFYTGVFYWKGNRYEGKHEALVSDDLFKQVQEQFSSYNRPKEVKREFVYGGLLTCANCGCAITGIIKKNRYVYYVCTNYHKNCKQLYVKEEVLDEQFAKVIGGLQFDNEVIVWVRGALLDSFEVEKQFHQKAVSDLQAQYNRLQARLEKIYMDKLDGNITEDFWKEKDTQWRREKEMVLKKLQAHSKADASYMLTGIRTLELVQKASILYPKKSTLEKRAFLNILLRNSKLDGKDLLLQFREPFDIIAILPEINEEKLIKNSTISPQNDNWWRWRDLNPRPERFPQEPLQV